MLYAQVLIQIAINVQILIYVPNAKIIMSLNIEKKKMNLNCFHFK